MEPSELAHAESQTEGFRESAGLDSILGGVGGKIPCVLEAALDAVGCLGMREVALGMMEPWRWVGAAAAGTATGSLRLISGPGLHVTCLSPGLPVKPAQHIILHALVYPGCTQPARLGREGFGHGTAARNHQGKTMVALKGRREEGRGGKRGALGLRRVQEIRFFFLTDLKLVFVCSSVIWMRLSEGRW